MKHLNKEQPAVAFEPELASGDRCRHALGEVSGIPLWNDSALFDFQMQETQHNKNSLAVLCMLMRLSFPI